MLLVLPIKHFLLHQTTPYDHDNRYAAAAVHAEVHDLLIRFDRMIVCDTVLKIIRSQKLLDGTQVICPFCQVRAIPCAKQIRFIVP